MSGAPRRVGIRSDAKRADLEQRIFGASLDVREAVLVERDKLALYGPEPDEVEEVLNVRYELFRRDLSGLHVTILAVHDTRTGTITILNVCKTTPTPSLYGEACLALKLVNPARERK